MDWNTCTLVSEKLKGGCSHNLEKLHLEIILHPTLLNFICPQHPRHLSNHFDYLHRAQQWYFNDDLRTEQSFMCKHYLMRCKFNMHLGPISHIATAIWRSLLELPNGCTQVTGTRPKSVNLWIPLTGTHCYQSVAITWLNEWVPV